jgi:hypothetical protein
LPSTLVSIDIVLWDKSFRSVQRVIDAWLDIAISSVTSIELHEAPVRIDLGQSNSGKASYRHGFLSSNRCEEINGPLN